MIADRHIFVIGQQWIVGPELLADIGRVVNADVEIGVVADEARHVHPDLASGRPAAARRRRGIARRDSSSTGAARRSPLCARGRARASAFSTGCARSSRQSSSSSSAIAGEVEHIVADRDAGAAAPLADRENAERQILDRKIAALRAFDPAPRPGHWFRRVTAASPSESRPRPRHSRAARDRARTASAGTASRSRP